MQTFITSCIFRTCIAAIAFIYIFNSSTKSTICPYTCLMSFSSMATFWGEKVEDQLPSHPPGYFEEYVYEKQDKRCPPVIKMEEEAQMLEEFNEHYPEYSISQEDNTRWRTCFEVSYQRAFHMIKWFRIDAVKPILDSDIWSWFQSEVMDLGHDKESFHYLWGLFTEHDRSALCLEVQMSDKPDLRSWLASACAQEDSIGAKLLNTTLNFLKAKQTISKGFSSKAGCAFAKGNRPSPTDLRQIPL